MHIELPATWFEYSALRPDDPPGLVAETPGPAPTGARLWLRLEHGPLGGRLDLLSQHAHVRDRIEGVDVGLVRLSEASWIELSSWPSLREVFVITSEANVSLGTNELPGLTFLWIEAPSMSAGGWSWIRRNRKLEKLLIRFAPVRSSEIEALARAGTPLRHLEVSNTSVDAESLLAIQSIPSLRVLQFENVHGLDEAIAVFDPPNLEELWAVDCFPAEGGARLKAWMREHPRVRVMT